MQLTIVGKRHDHVGRLFCYIGKCWRSATESLQVGEAQHETHQLHSPPVTFGIADSSVSSSLLLTDSNKTDIFQIMASGLRNAARPETPQDAASKHNSVFDQAFDTLVEKTLRQWHVPGLSIAVVDNGRIISKVGFICACCSKRPAMLSSSHRTERNRATGIQFCPTSPQRPTQCT